MLRQVVKQAVTFTVNHKVAIMKGAGMVCSAAGMALTGIANSKQQKIDLERTVKEEVKKIANN